MTTAIAERTKTIAPVSVKRASIRRLRATLVRKLAAFLRSQVKPMADQISAAMRHHGKAAPPTLDELLMLDQVVANLDFAGWSVLAGDIDDTLAEIVQDQAIAALDSVGIDTTANPDVLNVVSEAALDYGKERSAEMVGMRVNDAGELVQNPNAEWQITEGTRDGIRATVEDAMRTGATNDEIAASLQASYGFSDDRAMMIARTETQMAANAGALEGYKASGVVQGKLWSTADDDLVSEDCQENADAGELALDAEFPSGDDAPPAHPNCRCSIVPVVFEAEQGEEDTTAETTDAETTAEVVTAEDVVAETADVGGAITDASVTVEDVEATRVMPDVSFIGTGFSDAFRDKMMATLDAMPDGVMAKLASEDIEFKFAGKLIDIKPELKGVRPRGWRSGTWENAEGLFSEASGDTLTTETRREYGGKDYVASTRVEGVLAHETGHAFDAAMGGKKEYYAWENMTERRVAGYVFNNESKKQAFRDLYRADRRAAPNALGITREQFNNRFSYFLASGDQGPSETFAEVFGAIMRDGPASAPWDVRQAFPAVTKYIEDLIAKLESDEA